MPIAFPLSDRSALATVPEVEIETCDPETGKAHRVIIWVVAVGGRIFARSYRGPRARWYREALAGGPVRLHLGDRALPVAVVPAADPEVVAAVSAAFEAKYAADRSMPAMLRSEILATTVSLVPALPA